MTLRILLMSTLALAAGCHGHHHDDHGGHDDDHGGGHGHNGGNGESHNPF